VRKLQIPTTNILNQGKIQVQYGMSPKTHVIPCNISLPPFRSCSLVGYKLTLASALSGHLGRCFPALSPSLPGGWDGSTFQTLKPNPHGIVMVSWWCWRSLKIWGAQGEKAQQTFVCPPSAPSDYDSMSTLRVQPKKKLSQLGSSSEAVWKGKVFEIITQLFRSEPLCSWIFCGFAVHWATIFVSHNSMVSSAKNGGAATCRPCLAGIFPACTKEYRNISCLSIFGMNDLGCLKIGYPPIQEFLLISPIKLPFWSILGYPPLSDIPISLSANDLSILVAWDNLA
jgi:hypothetical protein